VRAPFIEYTSPWTELPNLWSLLLGIDGVVLPAETLTLLRRLQGTEVVSSILFALAWILFAGFKLAFHHLRCHNSLRRCLLPPALVNIANLFLLHALSQGSAWHP